MVIFPYKHEGIWVFDDKAVGLQKEPFVSGIPEMIELLVQDILNADRGFTLIFSQEPFPEYQIELSWIREEYGGHWYRCREMQKEGWLCPALLKYFSHPPAKIYCHARQSKK